MLDNEDTKMDKTTYPTQRIHMITEDGDMQASKQTCNYRLIRAMIVDEQMQCFRNTDEGKTNLSPFHRGFYIGAET